MSEIVEEVSHAVKAHPYLIGGAALLFVLIIIRSSSGGSSSSASGGLAAGLQYNQMQLQAGVANAQIAASAQATQANAAAQAQAHTDQTLGTVLGTLVSAKVTSDQNAQKFQLDSMQTKATTDLANKQLDNTLTFNNNNLHAQIDAFGKSIGLQSNALSDQYALGKQSLDFSNSNLPVLVAFHEYLANLGQGTVLGQAKINADASTTLATINAGAATSITNMNDKTATNIAGINATASAVQSVFGGGGGGGLGSVASLFL